MKAFFLSLTLAVLATLASAVPSPFSAYSVSRRSVNDEQKSSEGSDCYWMACKCHVTPYCTDLEPRTYSTDLEPGTYCWDREPGTECIVVELGDYIDVSVRTVAASSI